MLNKSLLFRADGLSATPLGSLDKKEEKYYLEMFKDLYDSFPSGEIIESEKPDFLIVDKYYEYGIELSKIFQQTMVFNLLPQASDSMCKSITEYIKNQLNELNKYCLDISINFTFHNSIQTKKRIELGDKILNLILTKMPEENDGYFLKNNFKDLVNFPSEISSIRLFRFEGNEKTNVFYSRSGIVQTDMKELLQESLTKKNPKLSEYKKCKNNWLVLYSTNSSGGFFDPSTETLNHQYKSNFDKIFLIIDLFKKVYELKKAT